MPADRLSDINRSHHRYGRFRSPAADRIASAVSSLR